MSFWQEHALEIIFGTVSALLALVAVYYARKALRPTPDQISEVFRGRSVRLYLSREQMIGRLLDQYDRADPGEVIWAQTVGMQNYPGDVRGKILAAASRGAKFRYLVNANSPALREFLELFEPVRNAEVKLSTDNNLRVQGLGDRAVVIAFPTMTTYTAVEVTDPAFVRLVRGWFDSRWDEPRRAGEADV